MAFCTVEEVRTAINFPASGAPVTDSQIADNIVYAEEEIEQIYHTRFGNVEINSVATSGTDTTIVDSTQTYTADEYLGYVVWIYAGTNEGEYREITLNTTTSLTVNPAFTNPIDSSSYFRITKLGYKDETVDGSGYKYQFVNFQPLIVLNSLTIDAVTNTVSAVNQYQMSGKLLLGTNSESKYFTDGKPQLINIKYVYGVYPLPNIIKRLCIILASLRVLTAQIAGTYDDFTSITLPGGFTGSKGEPYINIKSGLDYLTGEARGIVFGTQATGQVSADFRTGATFKPYTLFG